MKGKFLGLIMLGLVCWTACSSDEETNGGVEPDAGPQQLMLNTTTFQSSGEADFVLISVTSTGAWKADLNEQQKSWITVEPAIGTGNASGEKVKIYIKRNLESEANMRQGIISFRQTASDTVKQEFTITQYSEYKLMCDSIALMKVAKKLDFDNWLRPWNTSRPLRSWEGIYVNNVNGLNRVVGLVLDSMMNVSGVLPDELGELTALESLQFVREKKLTGNFPESLKTTNLNHVEIKYCNMGGLLPVFLQNFKDMTALVVSGCQYTGFEEGWMGDFPNLQGFFIDDNQFSGTLKRDYFRGMKGLLVLGFKNNNFSGEIPRNLFSGLSDLMAFEMSGNRLEGNFPVEISNLYAYKQSEPQINICPQQSPYQFTEGTCYSVGYVPPTEE